MAEDGIPKNSRGGNASGPCSVDGCQRPFYGRGYCVKHYKRWRAHGDPLGGSTDWGAAQAFIQSVVASSSPECVTFPFYRNADGYGWMRALGRNIGSHVYVAILAHGPKPSPKHEACHSCGKGHEGCVNPRHIYWGTRSDNVSDAYRHGTMPTAHLKRYGEDANACKHSDAKIEAVRLALARGEKQTQVARVFGISQSHVSRIKYGARTTL